MKIIKNITEWREIRRNLGQKSLGFVPTMGCLHIGHASLISKSTEENYFTLLSIFVNPTQFNNPTDYNNYPKKLDQDFELAEKLKVDYVLLPDETQIYPDGNSIYFESDHPMAKILEGAHRPGHFNGVLTIVMKLLLLAKASKAYFGEKDFQQLELIKSLVRNYFLDTEIIGCPIIRENSGLACSSRNQRLTESQRKIADDFANIFLNYATDHLEAMKKALSQLDLNIEYLEPYKDRLFAAIRIGDIRLIDNRRIQSQENPCVY